MLAACLICALCRLSSGLAELLSRNIDYCETPILLWQCLKIRLDEKFNRVLARVNFNANRIIAEIDFVPTTILSSYDGMAHPKHLSSSQNRLTALKEPQTIDLTDYRCPDNKRGQTGWSISDVIYHIFVRE